MQMKLFVLLFLRLLAMENNSSSRNSFVEEGKGPGVFPRSYANTERKDIDWKNCKPREEKEMIEMKEIPRGGSVNAEEILLDLNEITDIKRRKTVRLIDENKELVRKLLEQDEIDSFGVKEIDGKLEKDQTKNRFEIDDIGFRLTIRNVQDIDDENGTFETSFNVHLAWFDFKTFDEIWSRKDLMFPAIHTEVGTKKTTRIEIDLEMNGITQEMFGRSLPGIHFKKNTGEPPQAKTCFLHMSVIQSKNGKDVTGYFSIGYEYTSVKFRQVIAQENVPWDWQKFEYKFSLEPNLTGPDFRPFWKFDKDGKIVVRRSRFDIPMMMKTPTKERSLCKLVKRRFSKIKLMIRSLLNMRVPAQGSTNRVAGFYSDLLLSQRESKERTVQEQREAVHRAEYLQIKSDQLREWNLYGYAYNGEQGMLAVDYQPNREEDLNFVYFWAKRDPVEALEGVKELFLYSMIASSSWLMNAFTWDLASSWFGFGIAVLFVMTPVVAYRSGFQRTYVKSFFFWQKFFVTVEVIAQIVGRAPYFHCAELGGHAGEGIHAHIASVCLTQSRMLINMITIIVFKFLIFGWFYLSKNLFKVPEDCYVYYKTDEEHFKEN